MRREVFLHGALGEKFGKRFVLDADTPAEAIQMLSYQLPGFAEEVRDGLYRVARASEKGETPLSQGALHCRLGKARALHITPIADCAGYDPFSWVAVVIYLVIAVVVIATMPSVKPPNPDDRENDNKSWVMDGSVNVSEQGHAVPIVYGRCIVGSVVGSTGIRNVDVPYERLPGRHGGTGGVGGFTSWWTTPGFVGDIPDLTRPLEEGPGAGTQWDGGKGGSARAATEAPNTLQGASTAMVLDIISEGECVGLADGLKSYYLDKTPIQNADDSYNFKGISVVQRVGQPGQTYIAGTSDQEQQREINREISQAIGPAVETITDPIVNRARVTLSLASLYEQDPSTGDMKPSEVTVKIELQSDGGGYTTVTEKTFSGKCVSAYPWDLDFDLPAGGAPWDIRVSRVTPDSQTINMQDDVTWAALTEIVEAKLSYPDTAVIHTTVDARQFGTHIPERSWDFIGRIVEVPTNYDPVTREYATAGEGTTGGVWDGTFKLAWTDNPVWCIRDLLTNTRYGLGKRISADRLPKAALYTMAQYCDELVPNGFGGYEPRHTLNICIRKREKALEVINMLATNCRAMPYWSTGLIHFVQDSPADTFLLVNQSNIVEGKEPDYGESLGMDELFSAYVVWWADPEDHYRLVPEVVEDLEIRRMIGWRARSVTAIGETRRGAARRMGLAMLEDQRLRGTVTYGAGPDHALVSPGHIIELSDPKVETKRSGGRVSEATTTEVTLDHPVTLTSEEVTFRVLLPDGTLGESTIANGPGTHTVLELDTELSLAPIPGAVWQITSTSRPKTLWRVVKKTEPTDMEFEIVATQYDPDKYSRIENNLKLEPLAISRIPLVTREPPSGLKGREYMKLLNEYQVATLIPYAIFSWQRVNDPRITSYQAQVRRPGYSDWDPLSADNRTSVEVPNITPGEHILRVRSLNTLGQPSPWRELPVTFTAEPVPPATPRHFYAYPGVDGVRFVWDVVQYPLSIDYEIREGDNWESGQYIAKVQGDTVTVKLPTSVAVNKQFWIKALIRGTTVYSVDPGYASTYQAQVPNINVVVADDFRADAWAGGRLRRLTSETVDSNPALKLGYTTAGVRHPHGDYRDLVDLGGDEFYSRCYLEAKARNIPQDQGPTWDELETVSWDELGELTWTPPDGPLTDITIDRYIATDEDPADMLEAWRLGADNTGENGTAVLHDVLTTAEPHLHDHGVELTSHSLLAWDDVPFTVGGEFALAVNYTPATGALLVDSTIVVCTNGTEYLQLWYDYSEDELVLSDQDDNELRMAAPPWATDDVYVLGFTQTATERRLYWVSVDDEDGAFVSTTQAPAGDFDTIYLGAAGAGNQETWEDAGYTWEDIEATRTWLELALVPEPAPGVYSDLYLGTSPVTESDYETRMLLRGPAGFSDYRPLHPGDYRFGQAYIWQRLSAPPGLGYDVYITESVLHSDVPDVFYGATSPVSDAGSVITFPSPYHTDPTVIAVPFGTAEPAIVELVDVSPASFTVKLRSAANPSTLIEGFVHWNSRGY